MTVIDEDTPDQDRMDALKAMCNNVNTTDAGHILGYGLRGGHTPNHVRKIDRSRQALFSH